MQADVSYCTPSVYPLQLLGYRYFAVSMVGAHTIIIVRENFSISDGIQGPASIQLEPGS